MPASSSSRSAPCTVGAAAAWPKRWATSRRQCQSWCEYGLRVARDQVHRRVDVARLVGDPQVELEVGPVVGQRVDDLLEGVGEGHRAKHYRGYPRMPGGLSLGRMATPTS